MTFNVLRKRKKKLIRNEVEQYSNVYEGIIFLNLAGHPK